MLITYTQFFTGTILIIAFCVIGYLAYKKRKKANKLSPENLDFLNGSLDSIIVCDPNGNILEFNSAAEKLLGYSQSEVLSKHIQLIYSSSEEYEKVFNAISNQNLYYGNVINKCKDGKTITTELSANAIYGEEGSIMGYIGISRDISDSKQKEEQYQQIISNSSDIIYSSDFEGNFTYINPTIESMLGYKPEELVGKSMRALIHKDWIDSVLDFYQKSFKNREQKSLLEFMVYKKDGSSIWIEQSVRTRFDTINKNKIIGYYGIVRNIEEKKQSGIQLANSEEKFRELFNNSNDLIHSIDILGNIVYVNNAWKKTLEYSDEEIKKLKLLEIIHKESRAYYFKIFEKISTGAFDASRLVKYKLISKTGKTIVVEGTISLSKKNEQLVSSQSFLRNVTEQKNAEDLLKKNEANFRQITETINDVFYLYNYVENKFEYISPNVQDVLGVNVEFFHSDQNFIDVFVYEQDRAKLKEVNELLEQGTPYDMEYRILINGGIRWINERSFPIKDALGVVINSSGICRDITKIKNAQEIIYNQKIEIESSIFYGKNIQDATLPNQEEIKKIFPDSFVYYSPKDILSGDFYVVEQIKTREHTLLPTFIVADCTGHGVPGSMLSLLCTGLLKESFTQDHINSPADALGYVREKLNKLFYVQYEKKIQDGMDLAFCMINEQEEQLHFSGANNDCIIIRNNEILRYRGDSEHVGFSLNQTPFTDHVIDIKKGDCIYLYSDGIIDQFGGPFHKRFMTKRFHQLLLSLNEMKMPMEKQGTLIKQELLNWKGNNEQTDDITVMGLRW